MVFQLKLIDSVNKILKISKIFAQAKSWRFFYYVFYYNKTYLNHFKNSALAETFENF
nr:MAG TPA: hypothetical protein [Caudoviricetes sp.]